MARELIYWLESGVKIHGSRRQTLTSSEAFSPPCIQAGGSTPWGQGIRGIAVALVACKYLTPRSLSVAPSLHRVRSLPGARLRHSLDRPHLECLATMRPSRRSGEQFAPCARKRPLHVYAAINGWPWGATLTHMQPAVRKQRFPFSSDAHRRELGPPAGPRSSFVSGTHAPGRTEALQRPS